MLYDIIFWNPGQRPMDAGHCFGCATLGFFDGETWVEPNEKKRVKWKRVNGRASGGTFEEMLRFAAESEMKPKFVMAFMTGNAGNDSFVQALTRYFPGVPIIGGSSASDSSTEGQVLPDGRDGAILLVDDDGFHVDGKCIHRVLQMDLRVVEAEPRLLKRLCVNGEDMSAKAYFDMMRKRYNRQTTDFESITVQTLQGKNIHCSQGEGGSIIAGSNVEGEYLRIVEIPREEVQKNMAEFMSSPDTLAIGCAGLKSMLNEEIKGCNGNVGVFLFGEIVPTEDSISRFANLMMGRMSTNRA